MSKKNFNMFVDNFISGNEEALALSECGSFVLQRVIERAEEPLFFQLAQLLSRKLPDIYGAHQCGLIQAIATAAEEFPETQKRFVSALRKTLRCNSDDPTAQASFLACLVRMSEFGAASDEVEEEGDEESASKMNQLNLHGCLIAQSLFRFKKAGFIVRSVIASSPEELLRIGTDKMGNHVFEALFASASVAEGFKLQIVERMEVS